MWDLSQLVLIQKAWHALHDGRLDEAFEIANREGLRDHRKCQVLLEKLVPRLLERAREHFAAGRLEIALADVRRAEAAGGARTEAVALRDQVLASIEAERQAARAERRAVESARARLERGDLAGASARLRPLRQKGRDDVETLDRRIGDARSALAETRQRLAEVLERGDCEAALACLERLSGLAGECFDVRREIDAGVERIQQVVRDAWARGELGRAVRLIDRAAQLPGPARELEHWTAELALARELAAAIQAGAWSRAVITVGRLRRTSADAKWLRRLEDELRTIEGVEREILAGPIGDLIGASAPAGDAVAPGAPTLAVANPREKAAKEAKPAADPLRGNRSRRRFLLWVDGVGAYLVLTGEGIGIGRAGSSARPDVPLAADLEGVHAQIVRVDGEYFLVARGPVTVRGARVEKHLLRDRDDCTLGKRAHLRFRLPSNLSATAILDLSGGARLDGDVRHVVLLDRHLIFGADASAHVCVPKLTERAILSQGPDGFRLKTTESIEVDGKTVPAETVLPAGTPVKAGELTFTWTPVDGDGETP